MAYGARGEHEAFPGTVSIGHEALRLLLVELGRSAARLGGAAGASSTGTAETSRRWPMPWTLLRYEGRDAALVPRAAGGDAHAGRTETSLCCALDAALVRPGANERGNTAPLDELLPAMRVEWRGRR